MKIWLTLTFQIPSQAPPLSKSKSWNCFQTRMFAFPVRFNRNSIPDFSSAPFICNHNPEPPPLKCQVVFSGQGRGALCWHPWVSLYSAKNADVKSGKCVKNVDVKSGKCVSCVWHCHPTHPCPSTTREANFWFSWKETQALRKNKIDVAGEHCSISLRVFFEWADPWSLPSSLILYPWSLILLPWYSVLDPWSLILDPWSSIFDVAREHYSIYLWVFFKWADPWCIKCSWSLVLDPDPWRDWSGLFHFSWSALSALFHFSWSALSALFHFSSCLV